MHFLTVIVIYFVLSLMPSHAADCNLRAIVHYPYLGGDILQTRKHDLASWEQCFYRAAHMAHRDFEYIDYYQGYHPKKKPGYILIFWQFTTSSTRKPIRGIVNFYTLSYINAPAKPGQWVYDIFGEQLDLPFLDFWWDEQD